MPLGRALESASVNVLLNKLASQQVIDFFLKWKIDVALLTKLKTFLLMVDALLNHAEERQVEDPHVKAWLDEVKDAAYDAEDILDEIATDALESLNSTNKVRNFVYHYVDASDSVKEGIDSKMKDIASALNPFKERIESKMTTIVGRLEDIAKQKDILRLRADDGGRSARVSERLTTPMVDVSRVVYGRDIDKKEIINLLIPGEGNGNDVVGVIPIVGMGGVGKTTLAQIVYNDVDEVKKHFDLRAWACVSDEFDVMRITKALVESASKSTNKTKNLELLQQDLKNRLRGKKFLLVLDDVWNEDYGSWDDLRVPFTVGAPGSRIIVTTRNNKVASIMGTVPTYHLKELSKDDCWSLFEQIAFPNKNSDAYPKLKEIGEEIVKKCKGLPLAAKALGGLLRSETDEKYWNDILHSKLWNLPNDKILPALRLSYHHLPTHLKQCFVYCSMFQKDYEFEEEKLVQLWMAEGFLQPQDENERFEDVGSKYFSLLLSRSFFQQFSGDKSRYVMHDLIHDLAQFVSGKVCLRLEGKTEIVKQKNVYEKARHFSYIRGDDDVFPKFEPFSKLKCLRTFLPLDPLHGFRQSYLTNKVPHDLLPKLRFLRVLSLSGYLITNLPDSIGDHLKHLRYLNLSHSLIEELPDSVSSLFNLQTLILYRYRFLTKLPADMGSLTNLRHLNTVESILKEMPLRMGRLTCLQTLSNFVVGKGSRPGIGEFKDLLHLQGTLSISELQNVANVKDAIEARLQVKPHLNELILEWSNEFDDLRNEDVETEILDALEPHENLKRLSIKYYGGTEFPSWMEDTLLTNLVILNLYGCKNCERLPSLSQLPLLKDLVIEGMAGIRDVGVEFHGDGQPFPALETLKFENMKEWEKWSSFGDLVGFPHLRELSIFRCPKLTKFSHHFASLEKLRIKKCEELTEFSSLPSSENLEFPRLRSLILVGCAKLKKLPNSLPSLQALEIDGCEEVAALPRLEKLLNFELLGSNVEVLNTMVDLSSLISLHINKISFDNHLPERFVQLSTKLEELKIVGCGGLVGLSHEHVGLRQFAYLRRLKISYCPELIALPDEKENLPPKIEFLDLRHCKNLEKLPYDLYKLECLRELRFEGCPKLMSLPDMGLPWMLKILEIQNCAALETIPEGILCNNTSLEYLEIRHCPSLVSFLQKGKVPSTLKHLKLYYCRSLELLPEGLMCKDNMNLEYLEIDNCSSLESFPRGELPTTLRRLELSCCANLKSLPVSLLNLKNLNRLEVSDCPSLEEFPGDGLPKALRSFQISGCENLKSLPYRIQNLTSLKELVISGCSSLVSLPKQGLPTKINSLDITYCEKLNPVHEWKLHKLSSLEHFSIGGCPGLISFSNEYLLPHSITSLHIIDLPDLESLSEGLLNLSSLETLLVRSCGKLQSLPKEGLPAMLSSLTIRNCPLLTPRCIPDKGEDWPKIANIPFVDVN